MKRIITKKKLFEDTVYTVDEYQKEKFKSDLARKGINELNYIMITINCPKRFYIWEPKKQLDYLIKLLNSLHVNYVACIEYCDERSNGFHLHFIISKEDLNVEVFPDELFVDDLFHKSVLRRNHCLDRCLGYLTKERKDCTAYNRKEKFYFSNIQERKLIPIGIRPITKYETPYEAIEETNEEIVQDPQNNPKKKYIVFFKDFLNKVKSVISGLFNKNQEQYYNDYKKEIVCQSTRDGPASRK
jgi:hypothetical protein